MADPAGPGEARPVGGRQHDPQCGDHLGVPVDIVKIDKSFVDRVDTDAKVRALVCATIEIG
jgi:hypothetical protein